MYIRAVHCLLRSFYTGRADDMIFDRCDIELTLFDNYQFFKSAIKKSNLRWFGMISSPGLDISSSSQFKIITDPSKLSAAEIEELTSMVMSTVERLDVGLRLKLKEIIRQDLNRYNLAQPEEKKEKYASSQAGLVTLRLPIAKLKACSSLFSTVVTKPTSQKNRTKQKAAIRKIMNQINKQSTTYLVHI